MLRASLPPAELAQLARLIQPTATTGKLTPEAFEELMQTLQAKNGGRPYTSNSIEAARLVLVMGAKVTEAARELGMSKQSVYQLMERIRRRLDVAPEGWMQCQSWFPPELIPHLDKCSQVLKDNQADGRASDSSLLNALFTLLATESAKETN